MRVRPPRYVSQYLREKSYVELSMVKPRQGELWFPSGVSEDVFMAIFVEDSQVNVDLRSVLFKKRAFKEKNDLKWRVTQSLVVSSVIHALSGTGSDFEPVTVEIARGRMKCCVTVNSLSSRDIEALEDAKELLPEDMLESGKLQRLSGMYSIDIPPKCPSDVFQFVGDILGDVIRNIDAFVSFSAENVGEDEDDELKEMFVVGLSAALRFFFKA